MAWAVMSMATFAVAASIGRIVYRVGSRGAIPARARYAAGARPVGRRTPDPAAADVERDASIRFARYVDSPAIFAML
jgi:hypothetical protein